MASLTVLTDADVQKVLSHLTRDEVLSLQVSLRKALHEYSTSGDRNQPECVFNQLERLKMDHPNGNTTLFMPSKGSKGIGMKGSINATELPCNLLSADVGDSCDSGCAQGLVG